MTFRYSYDDAGNILTANGHTYTYGDADWGDLLTAYDGKSISYDGGGNPLSYNGWNFTWKKGRQLATATNGSTTVSYTYDADGLRTSKTVNGVTYTYYYVGSQLARMTYGDYVLDFFYDVNGTPLAMRQGYLSSNNYTVYYYITNLQGDVIRLVDVNGSTAAYYEYDPYGNAIQAAGSHCNINPLRYRGYVYDQETSLYYVSSRYYDPEISRWINADAISLLGANGDFSSLNLFVYCGNNPVIRKDVSGEFWLSALVGAVVNVVTTYIAAKATGQEYTWVDAGVAALSGAVNAIPGAGPLLSGGISGAYAGITAYRNGASAEEAILCGVVSGVCTTASVTNIANAQATQATLDLATATFTDLVFGTGYNTISTATYAGIMKDVEKRNNNNPSIDAGCASFSLHRSRISQAYTVDMLL